MLIYKKRTAVLELIPSRGFAYFKELFCPYYSTKAAEKQSAAFVSIFLFYKNQMRLPEKSLYNRNGVNTVVLEDSNVLGSNALSADNDWYSGWTGHGGSGADATDTLLYR